MVAKAGVLWQCQHFQCCLCTSVTTWALTAGPQAGLYPEDTLRADVLWKDLRLGNKEGGFLCDPCLVGCKGWWVYKWERQETLQGTTSFTRAVGSLTSSHAANEQYQAMEASQRLVWCRAWPDSGFAGLHGLLQSGWASALSQSDCVTAVGNVCSVPSALKTENIPNSQIRDTHLWALSEDLWWNVVEGISEDNSLPLSILWWRRHTFWWENRPVEGCLF